MEDQPEVLDEALCPVELNRIWELALHEERVLNERSGYFLIAHAMLLVFTVTAIEQLNPIAVFASIAVGAAMSIMWFLVNARQVQEMRTAASLVRDELPGYRAFRQALATSRLREFGPSIFAFGIPAAVTLIWLVFLGERLWSVI